MGCMSLLFKVLNPIMKLILRSPLHLLVSKRIMIISFTGRKSGRRYSTPVSYFREGNRVICFTHGPWWKNIGDGSEVQLRMQGEDYVGRAVAVPDDDDRKAQNLIKMLKAVPGDAGFYDVRFDENGEPHRDDVERAVKESVLIHIELAG